MKYLVCQQPGQFALLEKPMPPRQTGQALLRMLRVGICGTDLHAYQGNQPFFSYPRILGHELAAEIVEISENHQGLISGDKVAIMPYLSCGHCIACRNGKTNCCSKLKVLGVHTDGGMQEYYSLPTEILIPANPLCPEQIAIIEPLAIGAHAVRRANLQAEEYVVVMGCGPIGIGLMQFAKLKGARVIALDINEKRLEYAQKTLGIEYTVIANGDSLQKIREISSGDLATAVFDATGIRKALMSGPDYMAHGGRYILVGLNKGELCFSHPAIHAKEASLMCSRNATMEDMQYVMESLADDQFPFKDYISHQVAYQDMIAHFEHWLEPDQQVMKAMISFE